MKPEILFISKFFLFSCFLLSKFHFKKFSTPNRNHDKMLFFQFWILSIFFLSSTEEEENNGNVKTIENPKLSKMKLINDIVDSRLILVFYFSEIRDEKRKRNGNSKPQEMMIIASSIQIFINTKKKSMRWTI